jgi:SAM-dependent methyltransferase
VANFPPFKAYMLSLLDELIERHALAAPFLDFGCGAGDVALHLARRGWSGTAVDSSPASRAIATIALRPFPSVRVAGSANGGSFNTVVMLDVLEHIADDGGTLASIATRQPAGATLVLTVPTNEAREWRWDDELYGHLRRYQPDALCSLLDGIGYQVEEMWEVSFPVFWLLRRGYTAIKRRPPLSGTAAERTRQSATSEAWNLGIFSDLLSRAPWAPVFALQRRFRHRLDRGNEVMVLARRRAR